MKKVKENFHIIIAVATLLITVVGATYAYFTSVTRFEDFLTNISLETEDIRAVSIVSGKNLNLKLSAADMMKQDSDVAYYATEDGTPQTEENTIALASATTVDEYTYVCNYTLNIACDGDMLEKIPGEGTAILNVNGFDYDLYNTSFPTTISGTLSGLTSNNPVAINGSLRIINLKGTNQSDMAGTKMTLTFTAEKFDCSKEYSIAYNLDGGVFEEVQPTTYTNVTDTFTLGIPSKENYIFLGWTGTNGTIPQTDVTINKGSMGDQSYTANWKLLSPVLAYSCLNNSLGNEPYLITYTGECEVIDEGNENWRIRLLSDGTFTSLTDMVIDTFLVGGGGGGAGIKDQYNVWTGPGGGGGYTKTIRNIDITSSNKYEVFIGQGGAGGYNGLAGTGGTTTAFNESADGGSGGHGGTNENYTNLGGGKGGSGGSGPSPVNSTKRYGGTDGGNGQSYDKYPGGAGQGTTTKEFGEDTGTLYSSGGNAISTSGSSGGNNTGDGGSGSRNTTGGKGGSGVVVIRNMRNGCLYGNLAGVEEKFTYTGNCEIIDDGDGKWRIKFLTSGKFIINEDIEIDAFLVGGGGGGNGMTDQYNVWTGPGGGGGYTKTIKNISIVANDEYDIVVGAGGNGTLDVLAGTGGTTTAFNESALGGNGAYNKRGGKGGSGGSSASPINSTTRYGGTDGGNGESYDKYAGGAGQGTTTREFGENTGSLYASGGNAISASGNSGEKNTGNGGSGSRNKVGGNGGSGVVVIRNIQ